VSKWKEFRIEDIADLHNNKRVPLSSMQRAKKQGIYPYYGASGIVDFIDEYAFDGEYVLISEDGENLKTRKTPIAFKASGKFWVNNHAHIVKGKKDFHNDLITYYFSNLDLNEYITGAVQPKLNKAALTSIPFCLPEDEDEQKSIVTVLSSLDDKIDLLHRQNKTLESMAETLFRQWFVEGAKDDWETIKLGDIFNTVSGYNHKREDLAESGDYLLSMGSVIKAYGISKEATRHVHVNDIDAKYICEVGDIVITTRDVTQDADLLGSPGVIPSFFKDCKMVVGSNLYKLQMINNKFDKVIIYQALQSSNYRDYVKEVASGTSVLMLKKSDLDEYSFKVPPNEKLAEYTEHIKLINSKLDMNYGNVIFLEKLRDGLLPKLMSGEVRVV
jgi:type I restriction enzyme S subunit